MRLPLEKSCPLQATHTRLRQIHTLWHEALAAYAEPELFVARLNALLQAARSVTWVLQKEMSGDEGFDEWYPAWQEKMRADDRLRWLVTARNQVEKQGDLDLHSVARVCVLAGALKIPQRELEVRASLSPVEIAAALDTTSLPEDVRESGILEVERRWSVPERPEDEVLDLLSYCYGVLAQLVGEAHERRGFEMQTFGMEDHEGRHRRSAHPAGRLDCMIVAAESRKARWHLGQEALIEIEAVRLAKDSSADERARRRYDLTDWPRIDPDASFEERARTWHQWARLFLERDGGHLTVATLFKDGQPSFFDVTPDDDQAKHAKMSRLALEVDRLGCEEVIFTTEAWFARELPEEDPLHGTRARDRTDNRDALLTYALSRSGERLALASFYSVVDGKPLLEPLETIEMDFKPIFGPVIAVWALARATDQSP